MKRKYLKYICIIFTIILLIVSTVYRLSFNNVNEQAQSDVKGNSTSSDEDYEQSEDMSEDEQSSENTDDSKELKLKKGKTIVKVWTRQGMVTSTRDYQIRKYNKENKDNIYIEFTSVNDEYDNLLSISLSSKKEPDIFDYSYLDLIKSNLLADLNTANIDLSNIDKNCLVCYNGIPLGTRISEENVKLIWNKEIFKKAGLNPNNAPKTWNEVLNYSRIIKQKYKDINPLEFPFSNYQDMKITIGEPSVLGQNIYTSFWNYKEGKYDFNPAENILKLYNKMYSEKLIDKNFDMLTRDDVISDFYSGKSAMLISGYNDKNKFVNVLSPNFELGISDLPKFNINDKGKYYFISSDKFLVINKESVEDLKKADAVKKVYEFLISKQTNNEIKEVSKGISKLADNTIISTDKYSEYDNAAKFDYEVYDPTLYVNRDVKQTKDSYVDAIKGNKKINDVIAELNDNYKNVWNYSKKINKLETDYYITNK